MAKQGLDLQSTHLIGHSLGAHLLGYAARTARSRGHVVSRVTGLDPAGPGFFPLNVFLTPLNFRDADFVDIIHTDIIVFGGSLIFIEKFILFNCLLQLQAQLVMSTSS